MFKKNELLKKLRNNYGSWLFYSKIVLLLRMNHFLEDRVSLYIASFQKNCEQFPLEVKFVEEFQKQNGEEFAVEVKFFPRS